LQIRILKGVHPRRYYIFKKGELGRRGIKEAKKSAKAEVISPWRTTKHNLGRKKKGKRKGENLWKEKVYGTLVEEKKD